uniref:Uncharacterized protein n=1 Tax=Fagus sylvatica TaxID=28930 RepID=A0A2N9FJ66_FAGSY
MLREALTAFNSAAATAAGGDGYEVAKGLYNEILHRRDDILAQAKTKFVTPVFEAWISRVMKSKEEVQELEIKKEKIKKRTLAEFLCESSESSKSRAELIKSMVETCEKLCNLLSKGNLEMVEKLPERVMIKHEPKTKDKKFFYSIVEDILGHLRDKNVKRIGLWGMAGVGKTTIMQNLNNNENIAKMFDIVIWVTVSKVCNLEKLQHAIADRLKLNMEGITDRNEIAEQICRELKGKKCLLLLDDVRKDLDLDLSLIGMDDNERDIKVVLTTRHRHVCYDMETDEPINVQPLSEDDAWEMFKVKVGKNVNHQDIEPIAKLVAKECACLPLLIDKVAKIFRRKGKSPQLWDDGLSSLQRWPHIEFQGIDELIKYLEFCYEDIDDEVKKDCFLYSAIYPEDNEIYIDYLLECWRAEGFILDANEFRVARNKGHSILKELINMSLLEWSEKMNHVRMNKVLRNMALNISSRSCNFKILVKPLEGLREAPNDVEWQQANRISLIDNKLCTLPEKPDCNNLSTLLLQINPDLRVIPKSFFGCMQNLRVLDLHGTGITSLPSSMSCLNCLRALYLNYCTYLKELCCLEGLGHLEVLDIRDTRFKHFPIQIGYLIQLKCLRMSLSNFGIEHSSNVEFCRNVFSRLQLLEELRIDLDPNNQSWEATVKAISEEVATLTNLTSLSICFPTVDCLRSYISASSLWKNSHFTFQFSVGYHGSTHYQILDCFKYQIKKCLKLANGEGVDPIISDVLLETDAFELIGHTGASRLSDFGIERIKNIRGCLIKGCNEIETIVDGNGITRSVLECLEKMLINNVPKLESIWEGPVHYGSLSRLTTLTLCNCLKLKKIFSSGMIQQLSELQQLTVEECPEIEEIITESENNGLVPDALPRLKMLVLSNLPKVKSIWIDDSLNWPSLKRITIFKCEMLTRLPFNNENAINLKCIEADQISWSALAWQDDTIENRLQSIWFQSA